MMNKPERTSRGRAEHDRAKKDAGGAGETGGAGGGDQRRAREQTPMQSRADDAADVEGKDAVQLGSEGSFPASDPPSWMGSARTGGRDPCREPPHQQRGDETTETARGADDRGKPGMQ
jgi:hypothetical protein